MVVIAGILRVKLGVLSLMHLFFFINQMKVKATKEVKKQRLFHLKTLKPFRIRMQLGR